MRRIQSLTFAVLSAAKKPSGRASTSALIASLFSNSSPVRYFSFSKQHTMRLVQFKESGQVRVGAELGQGGDVVDLCAGNSSIPPGDMKKFLEGGNKALDAAKQ